jgi:sulfatase maturation enzyme AslB (radical SAM superfamily)
MTVERKDLNNFFNVVKSSLGNNKPPPKKMNKQHLNTSINDNSKDQRTNVIYLNTDCNLRCEYCYESDSREGLLDQANCTTKDIDNFLTEICEREKESVSTVVIMGGEPFLKFDLIEYTILKAASLKEKKRGWGFSIVSNGTLFTDSILTRYKEIINIARKHSIFITQEVSYDCSGQFRRKWPNGSNSKEHVEKGIQKLIDYEIPFRISYTVHSGNYNNVVKDCIYLLEKYPKKYQERITVGWAYQDLDRVLGPDKSFELKENFKPYAEYLLELYGVPICGNSCDACSICNQSNFVGNSYLSPTTGITYAEKITKNKFLQF